METFLVCNDELQKGSCIARCGGGGRICIKWFVYSSRPALFRLWSKPTFLAHEDCVLLSSSLGWESLSVLENTPLCEAGQWLHFEWWWESSQVEDNRTEWWKL